MEKDNALTKKKKNSRSATAVGGQYSMQYNTHMMYTSIKVGTYYIGSATSEL